MKKTQIVGWVISALLFALLTVASARAKLTDWDGKAEMFGEMGFTLEIMRAIGFVEIAIAVAFMIPRTSFLGVILLTGYLGGATAVHVRVGEAFVAPLVVGIVAWIALGLRDPRVFRMAFGASTQSGHPPASEA